MSKEFKRLATHQKVNPGKSIKLKKGD